MKRSLTGSVAEGKGMLEKAPCLSLPPSLHLTLSFPF